MEWISVKERLPEEETIVLVWAEWRDDPGAFDCDMGVLEDGDWLSALLEYGDPHLKLNVTHWMPLPSPPK